MLETVLEGWCELKGVGLGSASTGAAAASTAPLLLLLLRWRLTQQRRASERVIGRQAWLRGARGGEHRLDHVVGREAASLVEDLGGGAHGRGGAREGVRQVAGHLVGELGGVGAL